MSAFERLRGVFRKARPESVPWQVTYARGVREAREAARRELRDEIAQSIVEELFRVDTAEAVRYRVAIALGEPWTTQIFAMARAREIELAEKRVAGMQQARQREIRNRQFARPAEVR